MNTALDGEAVSTNRCTSKKVQTDRVLSIRVTKLSGQYPAVLSKVRYI